MGELTSQLHFPTSSRCNVFLGSHCNIKGRAIRNTSHAVENLRNAVVCKHGDLVDVPEFPMPLALEARPYISNKDLGSLQNADWLSPPLKAMLVTEAVKVPSQEIYKSSG